jgi:ATP diphosphatase
VVRRHPHVFGNAQGLTPDEVRELWERIKTEEQSQKPKRASSDAPSSALAGVPVTLPALARALKLQTKAGKVGFDWKDPLAVLAKIRALIGESRSQRQPDALPFGVLLSNS